MPGRTAQRKILTTRDLQAAWQTRRGFGGAVPDEHRSRLTRPSFAVPFRSLANEYWGGPCARQGRRRGAPHLTIVR